MINGESDEVGVPVAAEMTAQERDLLWEKLVYTCSYLDQSEINRIVLLDYIILMSKTIRALVALNALAYVLLIAFFIFIKNPELNMIGGLGVGFLSGATFIIWVVKDVFSRSKK